MDFLALWELELEAAGEDAAGRAGAWAQAATANTVPAITAIKRFILVSPVGILCPSQDRMGRSINQCLSVA
jgi:hypothetical protein